MKMFIKLSFILLVLHISAAQNENHDWDLAVVINDQIELLLSNGTVVGSTVEQFSKLKALTFDNIRHQFVVSDMDQQNDTIFTVHLTKETDIQPIIEDLPDDVQGLAIDPITDILYWTDSINKTINYVSLNDSTHESKILFAFTDENPQDVAVDVCHRFLYWTNSNINKPTIERAKLDGTQHEVLVDSGLHRPAGIAIDYKSQRLFWADMKEGIYYSIESTNLEGKEREIVYEGTHSKPFGVAVDSQAIYWTDINNNALWKISKHDKNSIPKRLREFEEKPMGIVAKNVQITNLPECKLLSEAVKTHNVTEEIKPTKEEEEAEEENIVCLNDGELVEDKYCKCLRGFTGRYCEISLCHNYCIHGDCYYSSLGYPKCHCLNGFKGARCEMETCEGFCLNGGLCSYSHKLQAPSCECSDGFSGSRCEINGDICSLFCQERGNEVLTSNDKVLCRCIEGSSAAVSSNITSAQLISRSEQHPVLLEHFQDPAFLVLSCILLIMLIMIILLSIFVCSMRRRPRIKKRIIVNKNVTPLTYRPQPTTEQCEITIENCCNMNICETPCFEPPQLGCPQTKNDDKKKLLSNMENGEELY